MKMKKQAYLKFTYLFWKGHNIFKKITHFELFQFKNDQRGTQTTPTLDAYSK